MRGAVPRGIARPGAPRTVPDRCRPPPGARASCRSACQIHPIDARRHGVGREAVEQLVAVRLRAPAEEAPDASGSGNLRAVPAVEAGQPEPRGGALEIGERQTVPGDQHPIEHRIRLAAARSRASAARRAPRDRRRTAGRWARPGWCGCRADRRPPAPRTKPAGPAPPARERRASRAILQVEVGLVEGAGHASTTSQRPSGDRPTPGQCSFSAGLNTRAVVRRIVAEPVEIDRPVVLLLLLRNLAGARGSGCSRSRSPSGSQARSAARVRAIRSPEGRRRCRRPGRAARSPRCRSPRGRRPAARRRRSG